MRLNPYLAFAGRIILGVLLSFLLSVIGIGVGWSMFVFSGAVEHSTLMALFLSGAGIGAGLGSYFAWLKLDRAPGRVYQGIIVLVCILFGVGGAWIGFRYGSIQEVECCAGPAIDPITYLGIGSTIGANIIAVLIAIITSVTARRWWATVLSQTAGSDAQPQR